MSSETRPLKILQLKEGSSEVEIIQENLQRVSDALRHSGANLVSIVAVMGAYRTGKSFLLDLLMRFLRTKVVRLEEERRKKEERRAAARRAAEAGDEAAVAAAAAAIAAEDEQASADGSPRVPPELEGWHVGDEPTGGDPRLPAWVLEGDAQRISEGSRTDENSEGFAWRPGKDKCTQGIWLWSTPFVFTDKNGRKIGVLLMDTQGAWDDTMTKAQSATIFGLTALLSSKLVYNIQNRIEEDKLENLDYITTFAQTVCSDLPGSESPFGHLELLVRDWVNYEDGFGVEQCIQQMTEHQDDHLNPEKVPGDAVPRVERLSATFRDISCFGLPHPGIKVTRPTYSGEIANIDPDFIQLLDVFVNQLFGGDFPRPCAPLGMEITVSTFQQVVMNFAEAFRENAQDMAIGLREAFVKVEMMTCREDLLRRFREQLARICPETAVVEPKFLRRELDRITGTFKEEFAMKLKPWKLKDSEEFSAISDFGQTIVDQANIRVMQNEQQVEGATVKLVASPVVGCGAYFLFVHTWVCYAVMGVGAYFHAQKWSVKNEVELYDVSVFQGIADDVKKWSNKRYTDVQAMSVALKRFSATDAMDGLSKISKQAGAMAASAAAGAGVNLPAGLVSETNGAGGVMNGAPPPTRIGASSSAR